MKGYRDQIWVEISNYRINKSIMLGKGATGAVYFGLRTDGLSVAVKSISINKVTQSIEKQIKNEITNLQALSSPFIVKFYDCFRDKQNLYLVLEYCDDGDLKSLLEKNHKNHGLSEAQALVFMRHLMAGYNALYKKSIIHRDIKPANILLKQGVAKLSDFGFSRVVQDPTKTQKLSLLGTPLYTAPEILASNEFNNKCDLWSMGVVFYEMLHGRTPWNGVDIEDLKKNIITRPLEFKANLNPGIRGVMERMLKVDRQHRISWDELYQQGLFAQPVDVGIEKQRLENGYEQAKKILHNYLKNYLVKSYLLLNTNTQVQFAPTEEPMDSREKSTARLMLEGEVGQLTLRRNFAFLHMYVLALYFQNRDKMPQNFNCFMEFEYSMIRRAYEMVGQIGKDFHNKKKEGLWDNYQKTPQYLELAQVIEKDFMLLGLLEKTCKKDIQNRLATKKIHPTTANYMDKFEKNFSATFVGAMQYDVGIINGAKDRKNVASLVGDYIANYIMNPNNILDNTAIDFAVFYEHRERQYGLN